MTKAVKRNSLNESKLSVDQEKHIAGLAEMFKSMGFEVISFSEAERQSASKQPSKPECGCDPIIDGKPGHICQTHLFESFRKYLANKESK